jgi:hypothetical protein
MLARLYEHRSARPTVDMPNINPRSDSIPDSHFACI